jgi:ParB-like nuclease domain
MSDKIEYLELDTLELDPENPRLPQSVARDALSMTDYIVASSAIEELMGAIAENGFFSAEPLVVVKGDVAGKYLVVEGNRRLTALKLLQSIENCSSPSQKIRDLSASAKFKPTSIPAIVKATRKEVLPYLGFRHITGIKQWDSLAKARYIEQLFNATDASATPEKRYYAVAKSIGSRSDFIHRNLDALAVYRVLEDGSFFNVEGLDDRTIKFSVLSTAIANSKISQFVGITKQVSSGDTVEQHPIVNPTSLDKDKIKELTLWLFERDEKGETRVGESRNIRKLAAVVDNAKALASFRAKATLDLAYRYTADLSQDFETLLNQAEACLTEASGMVASTEFSALAFDAAKRIKKNVELIGRELAEKRRKQEAEGDEF